MSAAPKMSIAPADQGSAGEERSRQRSQHWERIYETRSSDSVSWYEPVPERSLALIRRAAPQPDDHILDVGGGASTLVDELVALGYRALTVLDTASAALATTRSRLGPDRSVELVPGDILDPPTLPSVALWHDRAVFHFLTDAAERARYREVLEAAVEPGGHVVIATFSDRGPDHCSGLPVERYSPDRLAAEFAGLDLVEATRHQHVTPAGHLQDFTYGLFLHRGVQRGSTSGGTHG